MFLFESVKDSSNVAYIFWYLRFFYQSYMFMFQCFLIQPIYFSAKQCNQSSVWESKYFVTFKKCPPPKSVTPKCQHWLEDELILTYAVKLGNWLLHVFSLSLILVLLLHRTPQHSHQFYLPPLSFSLCVHKTVVWGQGRCLPSPYFRYIRPPKWYWKINDSPDQCPFQRQSCLGIKLGFKSS